MTAAFTSHRNGRIMSSTITAVSMAGHSAPAAAPPPEVATPAKSAPAKAPAQPPAAATAGSSAQQQAALNQMLSTYARDLSHGADARTITALGKKITAAAKALGQHVTLPHAHASAGATSAPGATPAKGKVNVTA